MRLPDGIVAFLDESVTAGIAPSRAPLVTQAVERERRRQAAVSDAALLHNAGASDDLDDLVAWTTHNAQLED